jgi:integrase/recombinase XerD
MARHGMSIDIHNYPRMYAQAEAQVRNSEISERNKALIFGYRDACLVQQTCGKVRLIRGLGVLLLFAKLLKKDFDQASPEDVRGLLGALMARQPAYRPATLATYRAFMKRFFTWLSNPAAFGQPNCVTPPTVNWLTVHLRRKDAPKLQRNELLTPGDIEAAIDASRTSRERALISVLWETGARIGEIGNLQVKHVTPNEPGFILDLNGKTGRRSPMIVSSAPALSAWLAVHPFRDNPEAPLWCHTYAMAPKPLSYPALVKLIREVFTRAKVTKRVHPHLFRHSRVTYVLATSLFTEATAKVYFGWTPGSDMVANYAHLVDADANNAILRENNMAPKTQLHEDLRATKCYRCGTLNEGRIEYCTRCNAVLDLRRAHEHQQLHDMKEELFSRMFQVMVERGLVDEAAKQIHDAGLGGVLKRLAQHASGEVPIGKQPVKQEPPQVNRDVNVVQVAQ